MNELLSFISFERIEAIKCINYENCFSSFNVFFISIWIALTTSTIFPCFLIVI